MISLLTEKQQEVHDLFLSMIEQKQSYFLSSEERNIGKTYTLNELSLTLQALGYRVFILTPSKCVEYYADGCISLDPYDFRERFTDNMVVIADEVRYEMMDDFLDYCEHRNVPVVGYVNFKSNRHYKPSQFEQEYVCEWK